jgi:NAD(P)-dependent dehydrogenase (short-subunit alcohol dehydrogenase family)
VSRGIGKALAQKFLEEKYQVIGTSTDGLVEWHSDNLTVYALDLAKTESIQKCASVIVQLNIPIDILINNAGTWSGREEDPMIYMETLRNTMEVNLFGTVDFSERIIPLISNGGHIVNITSRAGSMQYVSDAEYPDYKISKAALNMVTRMWAIRLKDKITVSSVHPGWVKTDMGGEEADIYPEEAATDIYELAVSYPETGQFWYKGKKFPW